MALSGEGGDELFGGYHTYVADSIAPCASGASAAALAPAGGAAAELVGARELRLQGQALRARRRTCRRSSATTPGRRSSRRTCGRSCARLRPPGGFDPLDVYRARYAETEGADELARLQDVDSGIYLVDDLLVKTDRASMAHSLEARVPFCDQVVAELALALPRQLKVRGFPKKRLLRQAVAPLLPRRILHGRKRGFSIPAAAWLRGDLEPFARDVLVAGHAARAGSSSTRRR